MKTFFSWKEALGSIFLDNLKWRAPSRYRFLHSIEKYLRRFLSHFFVIIYWLRHFFVWHNHFSVWHKILTSAKFAEIFAHLGLLVEGLKVTNRNGSKNSKFYILSSFRSYKNSKPFLKSVNHELSFDTNFCI